MYMQSKWAEARAALKVTEEKWGMSGMLVLVGLFCLVIGLFCLIIGLFCFIKGLFCHMNRSLLPDNRSLLTLAHTSGMLGFPGRPFEAAIEELLAKCDAAQVVYICICIYHIYI